MRLGRAAVAVLACLLVTAFTSGAAHGAPSKPKVTQAQAAALVGLVGAGEYPEDLGSVGVTLSGVSTALRKLNVTMDGVEMISFNTPKCTYKRAKANPTACEVEFTGTAPASGEHVIVVKAGGRVLTSAVTTTNPVKRTDWQQEMLELVNAERAKVGAAPLVLCESLNRAAQSYAEAMVATSNWSHVGVDGSTVQSRVLASGYASTHVGENLMSGSGTVQQAMLQWIQSPVHYKNILNPGVRHLGVGRALMFDGMFNWVQNFGVDGTC